MKPASIGREWRFAVEMVVDEAMGRYNIRSEQISLQLRSHDTLPGGCCAAIRAGKSEC